MSEAKGNMVRIYLDTSLIKRPFDDQGQPRIWLETGALSMILQMIGDGLVEMVSSTVHGYENSRNSLVQRRDWMDHCTKMAAESIKLNKEIIDRASYFERKGLKALDALHLACAEFAGCDFFVTCDDKLIRSSTGSKVEIVGPEDLLRRVSGD